MSVIEELEQAVKWKRQYEAQTQESLGLMAELVRYSKENDVVLAKDEKPRRIVCRMAYIIKTSDGTLQTENLGDSDDDFPAPFTANVKYRPQAA